MNLDETKAWIESRYGPISVGRGGVYVGCVLHVFIAAVPVYGGVASGIGRTIEEAIMNLRKDLSRPG